MTWFADLSPCDYCGLHQFGDVRAVGWLEREAPFEVGKVDREFFTSLCQSLQRPWCPIGWGGSHACRLCQFTESTEASYFAANVGRFRIRSSGGTVLFVPGNGFLYVTPDSVAHYIDAHHYAPPREFQEAVMKCPPVGSAEYFEALLANGGSRQLRASLPHA
jgi:hypothetical protein